MKSCRQVPFPILLSGGGGRDPFNDTRTSEMFSDTCFFVIVCDFLKELISCNTINGNVPVVIDVFILLKDVRSMKLFVVQMGEIGGDEMSGKTFDGTIGVLEKFAKNKYIFRT